MTESPQSASVEPAAKATSPLDGEAQDNSAEQSAGSSAAATDARRSDQARRAHLELIAMNRGCCA